MREHIKVATSNREELVDITEEVELIVKKSGISDGVVSLYAQGGPPQRS